MAHGQAKARETRRNLLNLHTSEEAAVEIVQIQTQMEIVRTLKSSY